MPRAKKMTPTGLAYGEAQKLQQAQAAVQLGQATPQAPPAGPQDRMAQAIQAAKSMPAPEGSLLAPSARPNEPLTAGLSVGPGPGPEALRQVMPAIPTDDYMLAKYMPMLELMANRPDASVALRNYVRRLRGGMNPQMTQDAATAQFGS